MSPLSVLLFLLFLLLSFPTPGDTLTTNFTFTGQLFCHLDRTFSYVVEIIEEDITEASDDVISGVHYHGGVRSPVYYQVFGQDSGDGPFDFYYEIALLIHHDCITDLWYSETTVKAIRVPIGSYSILHGAYRKVINFDITDEGIASNWPQLDDVDYPDGSDSDFNS